MQSLIRSWCSSSKNVSILCGRTYSCNFISSSRLANSSLHLHLLSKPRFLGFKQVSSRSYLSFNDMPSEKSMRLAHQDGIPDSFEAIYSTTTSFYGRMAYYCAFALSGAGFYMIYQFYIKERDQPLEVIAMGQFDNVNLKAIDLDDIPILLTTQFLGAILLALLVTRIPCRIYRSKRSTEPHYIAVYINKLRPWTNALHEFKSAQKLKLNFITRHIITIDTYKLGRRRAILFQNSFRTPYDHDEMINFQIGPSMMDAQKAMEELNARSLEEQGLQRSGVPEKTANSRKNREVREF